MEELPMGFWVLVAIFVVLVIIIIFSSYYHVKKAKFKPKFRELSDGSIQMEFGEFGGAQTSRTERFLQEYKIGQEVTYGGEKYFIEEIREVSDPSVVRNDIKMVCYLTKA
ncbi:MAG: hypothetical protein ACK5LL_07320 [Suipraeoptans sp.]